MRQILEAFLRGVDALGGWIIDHRQILAKVGVWAGAIVAVPVVGLFLLPYVLGLFAPTLDLTQDLYALNRPVAYTFLDAKGEVVGRRGALVGERLTLDQMPPYLPAAFIAMEDRRFYSHHGIDPKGLLRALLGRHPRQACGGRRLDHQRTDGQGRLDQFRAHLLAPADGADGRGGAGEIAQQAADSGTLSEPALSRLGRLRRGRRGAYLFRQVGKEPDAAEAAMLATLTRAPSVFSPRRDLGRRPGSAPTSC